MVHACILPTVSCLIDEQPSLDSLVRLLHRTLVEAFLTLVRRAAVGNILGPRALHSLDRQHSRSVLWQKFNAVAVETCSIHNGCDSNVNILGCLYPNRCSFKRPALHPSLYHHSAQHSTHHLRIRTALPSRCRHESGCQHMAYSRQLLHRRTTRRYY